MKFGAGVFGNHLIVLSFKQLMFQKKSLMTSTVYSNDQLFLKSKLLALLKIVIHRFCGHSSKSFSLFYFLFLSFHMFLN